jgi:hypothetical protein
MEVWVGDDARPAAAHQSTGRAGVHVFRRLCQCGAGRRASPSVCLASSRAAPELKLVLSATINRRLISDRPLSRTLCACGGLIHETTRLIFGNQLDLIARTDNMDGCAFTGSDDLAIQQIRPPLVPVSGRDVEVMNLAARVIRDRDVEDRRGSASGLRSCAGDNLVAMTSSGRSWQRLVFVSGVAYSGRQVSEMCLGKIE